MRTEWCFRLGGRLQPVREYLLDKEEYPKWYQRTEAFIGRVSIVRQGDRVEPPANESDDRFISRVLIGLLQRGDASAISPYLERDIAEASLGMSVEHSPDGLGWQFRLDTSDFLDPEQLVGALTQPGEGIEAAELAPFDSDAERMACHQYLRQILGPAMCFLDSQRPLQTMVPIQHDRDHVVGQRVDFALETPSGLKVVFEIDGSQHLTKRHIQSDRVRDERLRKSGWVVERIPTHALSGSRLPFSPGLLTKIQRDPAIKIASSANPSREAAILANVPHEVVRYQMAILLALFEGDLSLDAPHWTVAVVERDHGVAEMAAGDLHRTMSQLCALYGLEQPPRINLLRVQAGRESILVNVPYRHVVAAKMTRDDLDLGIVDVIIDSTFSAKEDDLFTDTVNAVDARHLPGHIPVYAVTTAPHYREPQELPWVPVRPIATGRHASEALQYFLRILFRQAEFRPMQRQIIERAMSRKDVLGLLPTGGGKSLTFQMSTLLSPGMSIIVTPLKSLIDDQVYNLHQLGINRVVGIHSGKSAQQKSRSLAEVAKGAHRFLYIAPERFQSEHFRVELKNSSIRDSVVFGVIDEAHCVSEWGHQFRPSYLMVGKHAREMFAPPGSVVPVIALTATASSTVLSDIQRELNFDIQDEESIVEVLSHARPNLNYVPILRDNSEKLTGLELAFDAVSSKLDIPKEELLSDPQYAGLVFCRFVNGDYGVDGVYSKLAKRMPAGTVHAFSGAAPKNANGVNWDAHKARVQNDFKQSKFPLLVSTSAFGMGVDKGNIRYTIHYGIPDSTEALVQESGRCGRDGREAVCAVVYSPAIDVEAILNPELDADVVRKRVSGWDNQSDIRRILFLNSMSYPGVNVELSSLQHAYQQIQEEWNRTEAAVGETLDVTIRPSKGGWDLLDKSIYRLTILGIVTDYTIDWASRLFHVTTRRTSSEELQIHLRSYFDRYPHAQFSGASNPNPGDYVDESSAFTIVARALIAFTYDHLERARRQALSNLVGFIEDAKDDGQKLRGLITNFLTRSSFTSIARNLSSEEDERAWFETLDLVQHEKDRRDLARAVQRQLESEANHPGLRLIYLIASSGDEGLSAGEIVRELSTVVSDYRQDTSKTDADLASLLSQTASSLSRVGGKVFDDVILEAAKAPWSEPLLRAARDHVITREAQAICTIPVLRDIRTISKELYASVQGSV